MVSCGDIIEVSLSKTERTAALVISNGFFTEKTDLAIVCPIVKTEKSYPLHISLDMRFKTRGKILCEHLKTLDLNAREYEVIEHVPEDLMKHITETIFSELEELEE